MPTLSTRTLAALAFERGEEFDPALTLVSARLAEDLALLAGARPLERELSPAERRRRGRARRQPSAAGWSGSAPANHAATGRPRAPRPRGDALISAAGAPASTGAESRRQLDDPEALLAVRAPGRRRSFDL